MKAKVCVPQGVCVGRFVILAANVKMEKFQVSVALLVCLHSLLHSRRSENSCAVDRQGNNGTSVQTMQSARKQPITRQSQQNGTNNKQLEIIIIIPSYQDDLCMLCVCFFFFPHGCLTEKLTLTEDMLVLNLYVFKAETFFMCGEIFCLFSKQFLISFFHCVLFYIIFD